MTAENTEPNDAPGGDDLRARYLPVSRKELRRRREAGIAEEPHATQAQEAPTDAQTDAPADFVTAEEDPAAEDSARTSAPEESGTEADSEVVAGPEREPDSAADAGGEPDSETAADSEADAEAQTDAESSSVPTFTTGSESTSGPGPGAPAPWGFTLPTPPASEPAVPSEPALPADSALLAETSEQGSEDAATEPANGSEPGGTSEDVLEDGQAEPAEYFGSEEIEDPEDRAETDPAEDELPAEATEDEVPAEATEDELPADSPAEEGPAEGTESPAETAEVDAAATVEPGSPASPPAQPRPEDLPGTDLDDQDEAPVPASRKSRRGLQVTENIAELSADKLAELQEINEAVAAADDPHRVDPELLKKQQALAARAMQANQERLRKEQVAADRDAKERRRRLRPESEVITRKALRAHMESDETAEPSDYATGSIEPIQARGAHGLEIDAMVEHSTRQGARQSMMGWLVIILAVLLVIALGVVLSFIL